VRVAGAVLGLSLMVAAIMPTEAAVVVALVPVGALAVFFGSISNAHMQLSSAPQFRGRVMAIYSLLTLGSTVIGGPFVGWVSQQWSPPGALGLAGAATAVTAIVLAVGSRRASERPTASRPPQPTIDLAT
jgi:MFS family permease